MEWHIKPGTPHQLGAKLTDTGCNFAIHAVGIKQLHLVIFDKENEESYFPLKPVLGDVYAIYIEGIPANTRYSYCQFIKGRKRWLLDPYANALTPHPVSEDIQAARVVDHQFDWHNAVRPHIPALKTTLLETHVKGFTKQHPEIDSKLQGTYLGLCQPVVIEHLKRMGITSVQLMPVTSSQDEAHLEDKKLTNFWGYNPVSFFAPSNRFATDDPVTELKTLVRELHKHNIEVMLDVVYNHTAESGEGGPVIHYKALDPQFYLRQRDRHHMNYTGCGNTVDLTHAPALRAVMDSLRHWVEEYHIDGFRFDLAATLGRRKDHFDIYSGFFQAIHQDPVLQSVKMIAEPWDIGPDGYQLGHFPPGWHECNDKFRDTLRSFWHNNGAHLGDFATRLMGSRDLFSASRWPAKLSINYITYHDGFTLQDLVSYNNRHNLDNAEQGKDGHGDNRSYNHGEEGVTTNAGIKTLRERQKRNMMASLMFSFGIPHLLAVDGLSHTQNGNNNAYCQDNEISWANWQLDETQQDFNCWLSAAMAARKKYMLPFFENFSGEKRELHRVQWFNPNGCPMVGDDWHRHAPIALHLGLYDDGTELLYLINPTKIPTRFRLPEGKAWRQILDTSETKIREKNLEDSYMQVPQSMTILRRY